MDTELVRHANCVDYALSELGSEHSRRTYADEVGLGKTIEAGLVIAQLGAEGRCRVLLITPKTLLGQWSQELFELFGIAPQHVDGGYLVDHDNHTLIATPDREYNWAAPRP